eukprot:121872-Chlamydomonas_euryale.AAC.3
MQAVVPWTPPGGRQKSEFCKEHDCMGARLHGSTVAWEHGARLACAARRRRVHRACPVKESCSAGARPSLRRRLQTPLCSEDTQRPGSSQS